MARPGPASPCISVCVLDECGTCRGCRRSVAEIARWGRMSAEEQWAVIARLEKLRAPERRDPEAAVLAAGG